MHKTVVQKINELSDRTWKDSWTPCFWQEQLNMLTINHSSLNSISILIKWKILSDSKFKRKNTYSQIYYAILEMYQIPDIRYVTVQGHYN